MSKNKGFSRVLALLLLVCMVVSFAPAAYADDTEPAQEEAAAANSVTDTDGAAGIVRAPGFVKTREVSITAPVCNNAACDAEVTVSQNGTVIASLTKDSAPFKVKVSSSAPVTLTAKPGANCGCKFVNWTKNGSTQVGTNTELKLTYSSITLADKTYTANFESSMCVVTYTDGVGGRAFAPQSYSVSLGAATPAFDGEPVRPGYKFAGWEPAYDESAKLYADTTYTAKWEKLYTVTYTDGVAGEEVFADEVYADLEAGTATPAFSGSTERPGWDFKGWKPAVAASVTEDVTYTAQWKIRPANTIYYNANGGEGGPVNNFSNAIYANVPTRVGYTFVCWNTESDGSGDSYKGGDKYYFTAAHNGEKVTLYAQWKANEYTLSRDSNGGEPLADVTVTFTKPYGDAIVASPRAGYTEDGWFLVVGDDVTGTEIKAETPVGIPDNHRIFLKRSIAPVTVTVSEDITKDYDAMGVTLTASTEEHKGLLYAFQWYKDGEVLPGENGKTLQLAGNVADSGVYTVKLTVNNAQDSGVITDNVPVSAEASAVVTINKIDNHLVYNYNGAENEDVTVDTKDSSIIIDAEKEVSRKGYTFMGWNTEPDGSGMSYKAGDELSFDDNGNGGMGVTLFAQWKANEYTLNFQIGKDPELKEQIKLNFTSKTVTYGEKVGDFPWAYREGYVLVWYDDNRNIVNSDTVYLVDGDSTYTAWWVKYTPPVKTGDSSNIALYACAMFASVACIGAGILLLRRRKEN